jgi:hypothetical protein
VGGFAALLASAALAASPIAGGALNISQLTGAWTFTTETHAAGCVITGHAMATRHGQTLAIDMHAVQTCQDGSNATVTESCVGRDFSGALQIRCTLTSSTSPSYVPDNFMLAVSSPIAMDGQLDDGHGWRQVGVQWRRPAPAAVS